jgi:heme-degrading monooxygenase HmoA
MHARHFTFRSSPEHRGTIEALADDMFALTRTLPGFVSATYLINGDETEYGSFTLWTSLEAAQAAGETLRSATGDRLDGIATAPPETSVMEVYEPAAG